MAEANTVDTGVKADENRAASNQQDAEYWKLESKKAFEARDAAKAALKAKEEAEEALRKKTLEEQNEFKKLYEEQQGKLKTLADLEAFKNEVETKRDGQISELSKKLTGESASEYQAYIVQLSKEKQLDWLSMRLKEPVLAGSSVSSARPAAGLTKAFKDMSFEERAEIVRKDPDALKRISRA